MKFRKIMEHALVSAGALFLLLGVPFLLSARGQALLSGQIDAMSSASVILPQPSGEYVVVINRDIHSDAQALAQWRTYFTGENDYILLFEDIACSVARADTGAVNMAESFRSRLPENQMTVTKEDSTLLLSRLDCGQYDMLILSAEYIQASNIEAFGENAEVFAITGETDGENNEEFAITGETE